MASQYVRFGPVGAGVDIVGCFFSAQDYIIRRNYCCNSDVFTPRESYIEAVIVTFVPPVKSNNIKLCSAEKSQPL